MIDMAAVKAELESKLQELEQRASGIENRLSDPGNKDWEENATLHEDDEVLAGLGDLTIHDMHEIKLALSRIEAGTYGICTSCAKKIPKARLTALPFATTCVDCA